VDFGLIVDTETTGLDPERDRIIEIGLLEFAVDGDGAPAPVVTRTYSALQDPGFEVSPEVTKVTGLETKHLAGQAIDWLLVRSMLSKASLVIAHNAEFDRAFIERCPELDGLVQGLHWACSMRHIDWKRNGYNTQSLNYLAADHGFVNPFAHRALFDCATTFRLVTPYLGELIQRSYEREYLMKATNSPFESKDALRLRGYRWNPDERCWGRVVSETVLADERDFLATQVYKGRGMHEEIALVAR
jgi:DNA polymerase-3 subunit epsilon